MHRGVEMTILGIDPGAKGAAVVINNTGIVSWLRFDKINAYGQFTYFEFERKKSLHDIKVYLEKVHGRPGDTPMTAFQFGKSYGHTEAALLIAEYNHTEIEAVAPQTWQREFSIANKMAYADRQRKQQAIAQELFPYIKVTQDLAAAILIAVYGWRKENGCLHGDTLLKTFDGIKRGAGVINIGEFRKR